MEVLFDVAIGWPGDASNYNEDKRLLQRACKTRWLSSKATVRARCEILGIWAALKQPSENKNDEMCVVLLRLMKKNQHAAFFVNVGTSPDRTEQSFSGGMF